MIRPARSGQRAVFLAARLPLLRAAALAPVFLPVAKTRASKKDAAPTSGNGAAGKAAPAGVVDPLQWWGALTTQFQEIAAGALREAGKNAAAPGAKAAPPKAKAAGAKTASRKSTTRGS